MSKERDIIKEANKKLVLATLAGAATITAIGAIIFGFTPLGESIRSGISALENRISSGEQSLNLIIENNPDTESTTFEKRITELLDALTKSGNINRAGLGIRYITINDETAAIYNLPVENGAFIPSNDAIIKGMPAQKAGLQGGDIIIAVDNVKIDSENPLNYVIAKHSIDDSVLITYLRNGETRVTKVKLEKLSAQ